MVDPIGIKTGASVNTDRVAFGTPKPTRPVEPVKPVVEAEPIVTNLPAAAVAVEASELKRTMAEKPPVDSERVARIRKAIEEGRFPLVPSTIADRLLALKMQWKPR